MLELISWCKCEGGKALISLQFLQCFDGPGLASKRIREVLGRSSDALESVLGALEAIWVRSWRSWALYLHDLDRLVINLGRLGGVLS